MVSAIHQTAVSAKESWVAGMVDRPKGVVKMSTMPARNGTQLPM